MFFIKFIFFILFLSLINFIYFYSYLNIYFRDLEEKLSINNLSLNCDNKDIYQFEGENYKKTFFQEESANSLPILHNISLSIGQRERKLINENLEEKGK